MSLRRGSSALNLEATSTLTQGAHVVKDANGRAYNRTKYMKYMKYMKHRTTMMQQWADYLDKLAREHQ